MQLSKHSSTVFYFFSMDVDIMHHCYSETTQNTTYLTLLLKKHPGYFTGIPFRGFLTEISLCQLTTMLFLIEEEKKQSCPGLFLLKSYIITLTLIQIPLQTEQFLSASLKILAERKRKGGGNKQKLEEWEGESLTK